MSADIFHLHFCVECSRKDEELRFSLLREAEMRGRLQQLNETIKELRLSLDRSHADRLRVINQAEEE
jgi:hypothetical protein